MEKHFVVFYSPGTFFSETSEKEVSEWNVEEAKTMAADITERYNATPYAFRFITRSRGPDDLDSKVTETSPNYFINCRVETLDEIKARNDPKDRTLIRNMEINGWDKMAVTKNGWKWTQPVRPNDVVLSGESA